MTGHAGEEPVVEWTAMAMARKLVRHHADPELVVAYLAHELAAGTSMCWPEACGNCGGIVQSDAVAWGKFCSRRCLRRARRERERLERAMELLRWDLTGRGGMCPHPGKRGFAREEDAVEEMNGSDLLCTARFLRAYQCSCRLWHLGHWRKPRPRHQRPHGVGLVARRR